ncbi:MAG: hypothetical protein RI990_1726 [Planctomycetota bacterium]|jgi:hypothetical protein
MSKSKKKAGTAKGGAATRTRKPKAHRISEDIRSLAAEVKDLRSLRTKYDQLLSEHNGLVGALRELSTELAGSARAAWNDYRRGRGAAGSAASTRTRVRASSADVDAMTAKLMASMPSAWSTKEQICKAAGLDPKAANSAFRRLVLGYKRDGKKVPPALESNGKRGTEGRYRKRDR